MKTNRTETAMPAVACAWLGCPFCGEQPKVTKHFKHDMWNLIHRCRVFTTVSIEWTTLEALQKRWNTRQQVVQYLEKTIERRIAEIESSQDFCDRWYAGIAKGYELSLDLLRAEIEKLQNDRLHRLAEDSRESQGKDSSQ